MKTILLLLIILLPAALLAQSPLNGNVTDSTSRPLDGVTVNVRFQDRTEIAVLSTDGHFIINQPRSGGFTLSASLIGYQPVVRNFERSQDTVIIVMHQELKSLHEVVITGGRPVIERRNDRIVFNVESSVVASGGTAWDALAKSPGVQAGPDGTLTANRQNVVVYLDGKPLHLSGAELAGFLQGQSSDMIARVEVYSNPPAKFDAQGASVINIISKRSKKQGLNVMMNSSYNQATFGSYATGASFNYRNKSLNVYGNYGFTDRHTIRDKTDYVTYRQDGETSFWNSIQRSHYRSRSHNYQLGADLQLNKSQVLGILITGNNRSGRNYSTTSTTVKNAGRLAPDSTLYTDGNTDVRDIRYSFNINYSIKTDTAGSGLNFDLDYLPYHNSAGQLVNSQTFLPDGSNASGAYRIYTPTLQKINIISGKADYTQNLAGHWKLLSGLKYSVIRSANQFTFYDDAGPEPLAIASRSDNFNYRENTIAGYASATAVMGNWNISGGLRGEYTKTRGYSVTLDSLTAKKYFNLFPSLFLAYKFSEGNQLQLNYANRLDRPAYSRLNPFKNYITPYNYLTGNPLLRPAFIHNLELSYTYNSVYNITAFYTETKDVFSGITVQDDVNKVFYNKQQNLGLSSIAGLRITAQVHASNWWDMSYGASPHYRRESSAYLGSRYDYRKLRFDANINQQFTLHKKSGLRAEINAIYESTDIQGIYHGGALFNLAAGLKTNVLKGKGTLSLTADDIFYSYKFHIQVNYLNQDNGFFQKDDSRKFALNFTYRLGKAVAGSRNRSTGSEEEKKRAQ
jgi:hypothetical protein